MTEDAYPDDEDRWVERRTEYLSSRGSHGVGFRDTVAEAVAWSELGYSKSGIASRMDTTDGTVSKYLTTASETYPGILTRSVLDTDGDPMAGVDDLGPVPSRECPVCLNETVLTPAAADAVFSTVGWGATSMLDDAELVCSVCHSVRIHGEWRRMEKLNSRAWALAEASSSKSADDYRDMLTRGIEPDTGQVVNPTADDAEDW